MKRHAWLVLVVGLLLAADDPKDEVKKEQDKLKGTWTVESSERKGQASEEGKDAEVTFEGDKITVKTAEGKEHKGTYKIDPTKKPKTIDITPSGGDNKDKVHLGIYELDGDTLKVCYNHPDKERPTAFSTKADSEEVLYVLKRKK